MENLTLKFKEVTKNMRESDYQKDGYKYVTGQEILDRLEDGAKFISLDDLKVSDIKADNIYIDTNDGYGNLSIEDIEDIEDEIEKLIKDNNLSPLEKLSKNLDEFNETSKKTVKNNCNLAH
ncbi:hypothetical protein [Aliarcobacter butzleri]|uniref:hypothetical protein n=1 Tax=Aliarcobacter butzleri TaxID=28197 RepID=UPI002B2410D9|nr:hypothetical protein [Aliarcobacter butzleri]